jgi:hypothetical protein
MTRPTAFRAGSDLVRGICGALLTLALALAPAVAGPERSRAARAEFQRLNPCPATGKSRGACPGWQVDHRVPLKCGGADAPWNLQWLTIEDHKAKTRAEAGSCRRS